MQKVNGISKKLMISGLLVVCVILIICLFMRAQSSKNGDTLQNMGNEVKNITLDDSLELQSGTEISANALDNIIIVDTGAPEIAPAETTETDKIYDSAEYEFALTVMPEKPEPPELPDTAFRGERTGDATLEDVEAHKALDPALTNPDVKPDGTPAPQPANDTPQSDAAKDGERMYFPGFGWITYTGPNIGEKSVSDGDWNKIIGSMN